MNMSTFTALNGGSPKATEAINGEASQLVTPTERTGGQTGSTLPRSRSEVSTSHRERDAERDRELERERERERDGSFVQSHERPPYSSANYPDVEGAHKRKRSDDEEIRRDSHPSPPERGEQRTSRRPQSAESRDPYGTPQRDYRSYAEESREQHDGWYSRGREEHSSYDRRRSAGPPGQGDEQIGDTLRRAAGQLEGSEYGTSPDGDEPSMSIYSGQYTPEQRRDGIIQSDAKKRKRNFSNRTKTGCLTCRKRKKKCDEQKPECKLFFFSFCFRWAFFFSLCARVVILALFIFWPSRRC